MARFGYNAGISLVYRAPRPARPKVGSPSRYVARPRELSRCVLGPVATLCEALLISRRVRWQALEEGGVRCELDAGNKYTPGQKFAHWEHKGVKLRVEVGPREAARKRCTLAKTFQVHSSSK